MRRTVELDPAAGRAAEPEDALHRLRSAGADEAIEAQDLALLEREGEIGELGGVGEALDLEHGLADGDVALGKDLVDRPADHEAHQVRLAHLGGLAFADLLAVAQADPAVGDAEDLVELVADEEDGAAFVLELLDQLEQLADLVAGQRRGRLVHDDDIGLVAECPGNLDHVLLRHRELLEQCLGGEVGVDALEQRRRSAPASPRGRSAGRPACGP